MNCFRRKFWIARIYTRNSLEILSFVIISPANCYESIMIDFNIFLYSFIINFYVSLSWIFVLENCILKLLIYGQFTIEIALEKFLSSNSQWRFEWSVIVTEEKFWNIFRTFIFQFILFLAFCIKNIHIEREIHGFIYFVTKI